MISCHRSLTSAQSRALVATHLELVCLRSDYPSGSAVSMLPYISYTIAGRRSEVVHSRHLLELQRFAICSHSSMHSGGLAFIIAISAFAAKAPCDATCITEKHWLSGSVPEMQLTVLDSTETETTHRVEVCEYNQQQGNHKFCFWAFR